MISIDLDVKIEKIHVSPTHSGMNAVFELTDAVDPSTRFYLKFYKKQVDYIMKKFNNVDREKLKAELRLEFLEREKVLRVHVRREIQAELAEARKAMTPRGVKDA